MTERVQRVTELIRREVSKIVSKEVEVQDVLITITHIELSRDLRYANIYFTTIPDNAARKVIKLLNKNVFTVQQLFNKRLRMRPVPQIRFYIDATEQEAAKIDEIIEGL